MLTAGIVIGDSMSAGPLLAALQQTGLIGGVKQWLLATDRLPEGGEPIPDVIVLDLGRDPEPFFAFGTYVRRLKPSVRVIARSAVFLLFRRLSPNPSTAAGCHAKRCARLYSETGGSLGAEGNPCAARSRRSSS